MKLPENKILRYLFLFLGIGLLVGILNTAVVTTTYMAEGKKIEVLFPFIFEMTGAFSFLFLLPVMIFIYNKYPLTKINFVIRLPLYLLVAVPLGILHTFFMYVSRKIIFDLAHFGVYDYGEMPYRFFMEYIKMCIGFATAYIVFYSIKTLKENEGEKLRRSQLEEKLTHARLDTLKSQLNPHFLFNTLNMISSTMYEDISTADKMIADLSELLRESLKNTKTGVHKLNEELKLLSLYTGIMLERFKDRLKIDININKDLNNINVPVFLLQPFIENSIKYCMEMNNKIIIKIKGEQSGNIFNIYISDNGPGIKNEHNNIMKSGLGLSNTLERLKNIYKEDFDFKLNNIESGGLLVTISIPLNYNASE